jgi:uncharacterized membrane protein YeaQ/YmgE (transglycosylase-associated protein family)
MGILSWIILGALAGWLASIVTGNNTNMGFFLNVLVGIVGAFVGNVIFRYINGSSVTGLNLYSLLIAFIGAVVLLLISNLFFRGGRE